MNRHVAALLGASLLWGCAWLPLKALGAAGIESLPLAFGAFGLLALLFLPGLFRQRGNLVALLLVALLGGGANLAFTTAMVYGDVVHGMVLFYLLPLWGVLGGRFILGERVDALRWMGVALALAGAWLVLGGAALLEAPPSWFELCALLAGLLYALNNLVFRAVQALGLAQKLAAMFLGCALLALLPLLLGLQPWPQGVTAWAWGGLTLYALGWLLLANLGAQWGITHLEAGRASVLLILELVAGVVSATWIGGETMSASAWLGAGLIVISALIEALRGEAGSRAALTGQRVSKPWSVRAEP